MRRNFIDGGRPSLSSQFYQAGVVVGVGLAGLGTSTSHAAIVVRNINHTVNAANTESYNLDIDQNGTTDFTFDAAYVPDPAFTVGFDQIDFLFGSNNGAVIDSQTGDGFPPTSLLQTGAIVSSTRLFAQSGDKADLYFNDTFDPATGNFNAKSGYAGLRFDEPDGIHYGYVQLTVQDINAASNQLDLTIGSVGYNTVAGQAVRIPEPISLSLVAGAAALLLGRTRRRPI